MLIFSSLWNHNLISASLVSSSGSSEQTDNTSFELDLPSSRSYCPTIDLKDFSSGELSRNFSGVDMKNLTPSSPCPSQRESSDTPPIYWSASQLLSKLGYDDQSGLSGSNQTSYEEGGREIPEEFTVTVSDLHYREDWEENSHQSLPRAKHITQVWRKDDCILNRIKQDVYWLCQSTFGISV